MVVSDIPELAIRVFAFCFGALWGSFFNVAIYRWPREMSVVSPPSHCPACGAPVPWFRNVPILAYVLQRGRAACCGAPMTRRYLWVEVVSGVLGLAIAERWMVQQPGSTDLGTAAIESLLLFFFVGGLLIATFVDLELLEIPDEVSLGGAALGLATIALRPHGPSAEDVAIGVGGGFLMTQILIVWAWERLTGAPGWGQGDPKFVMCIGAFLGWRGVVFAVVAGAVQAVLAYLVARATGTRIGPEPDAETEGYAEALAVRVRDSLDAHPAPKKPFATLLVFDRGALHGVDVVSAPPAPPPEEAPAAETSDAPAREEPRAHIPFGPFLALAALEFLFFGDAIVEWYVSLFE